VRLTVINRFVEPLQTRISVVKRVTSGTITVKRTATRYSTNHKNLPKSPCLRVSVLPFQAMRQ